MSAIVGLSLAPGWHCEIVPIEHFTSIRSAGDDVMLEVERYKRCLLRMFADRGKNITIYNDIHYIYMHLCLALFINLLLL